MSGGITAAQVAAGAAIVGAVGGTVMSYKNGQAQQAAAEKAQQQAKSNALKQEKSAEEAINRANQKSPDTMALLDAASQSGKAGASSTMLTGPLGVDPGALTLGKSTLLGK